MPALLDKRAETNQYPTANRQRRSLRSSSGIQMENVSRALKQRDGELLVCDVSLYLQLYQEHLQKSGGNQELAKRYTFEAIKKDGVALMQENISALSQGGKTLFDLESRARMQLTPTQNTYLLHQEETVDPQSEQTVIKRKMVSPEHAYIGRSVIEALTGWRRENDLASMTQNEYLFANFDKFFNATKTHTLVWGSPIAKESEGEMIHKYNGEYGYLYVGEITEVAGIRKMVMHSYKNDMSTEAYQKFMRELQGQEFFAGLGKHSTAQTVDVDRVMRTSVMKEGTLTHNEIYQRMFKVKAEVDGSSTMFGIDQKTFLAVQDPTLRQRLEDEASTIVAHWVVNLLEKGISTDWIQDHIKDKYIQETQNTIENIKLERMLKKSDQHRIDSADIVEENQVDLKALAAMKANTGAFCGTWGKGSGSGRVEGVTQRITDSLRNFTQFSGGGWGVDRMSRSRTEKTKCDDCGGSDFGECGYCIRCYPE